MRSLALAAGLVVLIPGLVIADSSVPSSRARGASGSPAMKSRLRPVGFIVPAARGSQFLPDAKRYWTPKQEEVDKLEDHLAGHLKDIHAGTWGGRPPLWQRVPRYGRQYVGFFDAKGRKRIWVNLFVLEEPFLGAKDIDRGPVVVFDGGDGFCRITWDPQGETFSDFNCNGEA